MPPYSPTSWMKLRLGWTAPKRELSCKEGSKQILSSRNYFDPHPCLHCPSIWPMFLRLAMDKRDGQHILPYPNPFPIQDKTPDPAELPSEISYTRIWQLARMVRGYCSQSDNFIVMANASDWPREAPGTTLKRGWGLCGDRATEVLHHPKFAGWAGLRPYR